jgi:hypothetical protein
MRGTRGDGMGCRTYGTLLCEWSTMTDFRGPKTVSSSVNLVFGTYKNDARRIRHSVEDGRCCEDGSLARVTLLPKSCRSSYRVRCLGLGGCAWRRT